MGLPSWSVLSSVVMSERTDTTFCPSRCCMRSVLCMPRSAMTPIAALSFWKNHRFLPGSTLQVSGPLCPKHVRNVSTRPIHPCSSSMRATTCALASLWFCPIISFLPHSSATLTISSHSSMVVAIGFSHSTSLPARIASMETCACAWLATHTLTASISGSARSCSSVS